MTHLPSALEYVDMTSHLEPQRLLQLAEGVHVLELCLRRKFGAASRTHGYVGVHPQAALLHVAVADLDIFERLLQTHEEGPSLSRRAQIRFGHDLRQWHAGSVQIHGGLPSEAIVQGLPGILLDVQSPDPHSPSRVRIGEIQPTRGGERPVVLGYLVALR